MNRNEHAGPKIGKSAHQTTNHTRSKQEKKQEKQGNDKH